MWPIWILLAYILPASAYRLSVAQGQGDNVFDCAVGNTCPFDIALARKFLNFSNIAYCPSASVSNWTCPACRFTEQEFAPSWIATGPYKVAGYYGVSHEHKMIVIAFRGSCNFRNWLANLNTLTEAYPWAPGARVHRGFYSAYISSFKDALATGVTALHLQNPDYKVYVTGHSLGAAQAMLCAADLAIVSKIPIAAVYTFGSPRVGNLAFAQWFQENVAKETFRFTHHRDIVPHVPMFGRHFMKFHHVPREFWQTSDDPDVIFVCDGSGEDRWCADSVRMALSVEDHLQYLGVSMGSHMCVGPGVNPSDPELEELLADEKQGLAELDMLRLSQGLLQEVPLGDFQWRTTSPAEQSALEVAEGRFINMGAAL